MTHWGFMPNISLGEHVSKFTLALWHSISQSSTWLGDFPQFSHCMLDCYRVGWIRSHHLGLTFESSSWPRQGEISLGRCHLRKGIPLDMCRSPQHWRLRAVVKKS